MRVSRHLPSDHHRNNFRFRGGWDHELQMVLVLVAITCVAIVSWGALDYILISNQFWKPHLKAEDHMKELRAVRLASVNQIADPWIYIIVRVVSGRGWSFSMGFSRRGEHAVPPAGEEGLPHQHAPQGLPRQRQEREPAPPGRRPRRPPPPKTISAHKSSYYSDSGTGSYSGVDVPLVAGVEVPLVDGVEAQALSQDALLRPGSKGGSLHQTLSKSLSVVIPIPLFTSEQYRVAACGRGECGGGHYCLVGGEHHLDCFSRPVQRVSSSASACERSRSPFITVSDCEDTGVFRSKSWSCHTHQEPQPQYRTQSTQTLTCGDPSADEAPAAPQPPTHLQASLQPVSCETPLLTAAASQEHLRVADCGRGKLGAPQQQQQQATPSPADFPKQFESKG
ncbi:putative prostaglandin E2 receptor EP4 subtype [Penaeus vannamei]|uniref:Putative prostaglandin E2 receptor EP4 subtype n=1 Tax=Penaeus vannamei TaxID=6689 RepID=A0A3R7SSL1_PENVA|nr:putative prostaglandin E2 receptor EP4 subtype [Penaeus vannamei]